jgi:hypothetical protein
MKNLIAIFKDKIRQRRFEKAKATINEFGLFVVEIKKVAGSDYLCLPDGTMMKLSRAKK